MKRKLTESLTHLRLPSFRSDYEALARQAEANTWSYEEYLWALVEQECIDRETKRRAIYRRVSALPANKSFDNFDQNRLSHRLRLSLKALRGGEFVSRKENILAFGNPGSGKTHILSAIGYELIEQGNRVYFASCSLFVQDLLRAKAELQLARYLKKLKKFDVIILDDLGYIQQSQEEMEVLFTFFAERYERGSVMISSNLPFSKWEKIFKNPMVTAAAIDRLVHHSVILELNLPSYRMEQAQQQKGE